jgi:hypothetical protein
MNVSTMNRPKLDRRILRFLYWALLALAVMMLVVNLGESGVKFASTYKLYQSNSLPRNRDFEALRNLLTVQAVQFLFSGITQVLMILAMSQGVAWLDRERALADKKES